MEGEMGVTEGFAAEMNFCLDCQACESACPAGVKYGQLVEAARAQIFVNGPHNFISKVLKIILLNQVFRSARRFILLAKLIRLYQISGLDSLLKKTGLLRAVSKKLHNIQFLLPTISRKPSSEILPSDILPVEKPRHRVGFLTGCIMDIAFAQTNIDTVELLLHHGCEVIIPPGQCCCGSLQSHNGDMGTARSLARQNIETFAKLNLDAIIMNSAGCGAFMKEYGVVLADDPVYAAPAMELAGKVQDISEFLFKIGLRIDKKGGDASLSKRVTYHDPCHLVHSQKISDEPRRLIQSIPGVEYVELTEASWCCGSAGIYNITHHDTAMQLLDRKIENVRKANPDIIVTGNPGCLIQLKYGLEKKGMNIELLHLATFLRRACCV